MAAGGGLYWASRHYGIGFSEVQMRVQEAKKLGFKVCILPKACSDTIKEDGIKLVPVAGVDELTKFFR